MSDGPNVPPPPPETPAAPPPPPPNAPPPSGGASSGGDSERTIMLVLSYLGLLALIPFFMKADDKEVRWHAKHGLVLFATAVVAFVGIFALQIALAWIDWLGCMGCAGSSLVSLAYFVVSIVCIVKAVGGERFLIPVISDFPDKF